MLNIIKAYVAEGLEILNQAGYVIELDSVVINRRLKQVMGRAHACYSKKTGMTTYRIEMSAIFTHDSTLLKETVLHELAHIADHQINGNMDHGRGWKHMMRVLGQEPDRLVDLANVVACGYKTKRNTVQRHIIACESCGAEYKISTARFNKLSGYRCHYDKSKFIHIRSYIVSDER